MLNNTEMLNNVVEENLELNDGLMNLVDSVDYNNLEETIDVDALFREAEKDAAKLALKIAGGALVLYGGSLIYKKFIGPKLKEMIANRKNKEFVEMSVEMKNESEETEYDVEDNE